MKVSLFAWVCIWVIPFWFLLGRRPKKTWWFRVNAGGMSNDVYQYRAPNVRNAYETVLDGFLANTGIQVEAPSVDCSDVSKASVIIDLLQAQIGIYR